MRLNASAILALVAAVLAPISAVAAEILLVVVIPDVPPYVTSFIAIPKDTPEEKIKEMPSKIPAGGHMVDWASFVGDLKRHVKDRMLKDEYQDYQTVDGLIALLQRYPGTPFGLTWNGGLAITYGDHRYAERTYQRYLKDATFVARPTDRRVDPVHPGNHIEPLLSR